MNFIDRLDRKFGKLAIPGLIRYVVMLNGLVFLLVWLNPAYTSVLTLDRAAIMQGEIWRLLSWIFIPTTSSPIWIIFYLLFTWWLGDSLESAWGTFRLNLYYLLGMLGCIASAFLFGASAGNLLLNLTLLLAVATLAPNMSVMLFGIIPVKMKWIALLGLIVPVQIFLFGGLGGKAMVLICLSNYFLFFLPALIRQWRENGEIRTRRAKFEAAKESISTLHCCVVCGKTEVSSPHAEFRVAADGEEYCDEHLPKR